VVHLATVEINGTTLFYTLTGGGQTCLVVHGGLGVDHTLYRTLDPLGQHVRLVYYDHRCNGQSGRPPLESLTMEQLADDAAALAASLSSEKVVVFGHSDGGFVAQEFALCHPDRVSALILCDTTPGQLGVEEPEDESAGPPPPPEFIEKISNPPVTDQELGLAIQGLFPAYLHRGEIADAEKALAGTVFSVAAMNRGFEVLSKWSSVDRLGSVDVPTLLLVGSHDAFTSPSQTYRMARRLPQSQVVEFADSGHIPWLVEPERFFQVVGDWLRLRVD